MQATRDKGSCQSIQSFTRLVDGRIVSSANKVFFIWAISSSTPISGSIGLLWASAPAIGQLPAAAPWPWLPRRIPGRLGSSA